jgi:hypothetical protein
MMRRTFSDDRAIPAIVERRFRTKYAEAIPVDGPLETSCLRWPDSLGTWGYGRIFYREKQFVATRIAWQVFKGEIPVGLLVCHHCDNPWCVNIDHLFLGTDADNNLDKIAKGCEPFPLIGEHNPFAKPTTEQAHEVYELAWSSRYTQREIARMFDITQQNVSMIKHRRSWNCLCDERPDWTTPQLEEITMPEWEAMQCSGEWTVVNEGGLRNAEAIDPRSRANTAQ